MLLLIYFTITCLHTGCMWRNVRLMECIWRSEGDIMMPVVSFHFYLGSRNGSSCHLSWAINTLTCWAISMTPSKADFLYKKLNGHKDRREEGDHLYKMSGERAGEWQLKKCFFFSKECMAEVLTLDTMLLKS